jgi:glycosyltransferase involved in cell wall biosynthesis
VDVFAPDERPVPWFPLKVRPKLFEREEEPQEPYDVIVYVGDTFRRARFAQEARSKYLLLQGKDYLWVGGAERQALLQAYHSPQYGILAVSSWLADFARVRCGNDRVHVIPNGVDLTRFTPSAESRDVMRILIEGNPVDRNKNVREALEIAARVRQYHNIEVWGLGRRFPSPGIMVSRIFEDPPQEMIPAIYQQCDLVIKTSFTEGFGLPQLEAMACGCVPVTYASGGVLDFCRHNENSLVAGVGNIASLTWHALRFCRDPALRQQLKNNAIATARGFPWSRAGRELEEVFSEPAGRP